MATKLEPVDQSTFTADEAQSYFEHLLTSHIYSVGNAPNVILVKGVFQGGSLLRWKSAAVVNTIEIAAIKSCGTVIAELHYLLNRELSKVWQDKGLSGYLPAVLDVWINSDMQGRDKVYSISGHMWATHPALCDTEINA